MADQVITTELNRLARHLALPIAVWMVAKGYLPEEAQGDFVEAMALAIPAVIVYVTSWWRDFKKSETWKRWNSVE